MLTLALALLCKLTLVPYEVKTDDDFVRALKEHYTKHEHMVPMRDGVKLFTFRTGHRIAVQVQSSWFPLFDRNPQTFVDIATAGEADFQKATHTVHRSPQRPSWISVRALGSEPAPLKQR